MLHAYPHDKSLCVYSYLTEYLKQTQPLRGKETRLFLSFTRPHKAISKETLSRWIRTVMSSPGIDDKPSSTSTSFQGYKAPKQRFNRPHFAKPYARAHGQFATQKANSQRHLLANSRAPRGAHTKQHTPIRKDQ